MKILMVGDIMGSPGRTIFARTATRMKADKRADFIVVNGENAAGGKGMNGKMAEEFFAAGADVITLGDHAWNQKDLMEYIQDERKVIRPSNFPPGNPGRGLVTVSCGDVKITVINLIGRVFMNNQYDCPFREADKLLSAPGLGKVVLVDFHAEATSEKNAMGHFLDGRVTAVVGTHTHVQTSDARILPKGTAYLTDLGMTGPKDSIIGCRKEPIIHRFQTSLPVKFEVASEDVSLEGVLIDVDESTGKPRKISLVRET
jgi:metallophosphoesterase (TIGR00282 family)